MVPSLTQPHDGEPFPGTVQSHRSRQDLAMLAAERSVGTEVIIRKTAAAVRALTVSKRQTGRTDQGRAKPLALEIGPLTAEPAPPAGGSVIERAIADDIASRRSGIVGE
jgi:hypothetical protein